MLIEGVASGGGLHGGRSAVSKRWLAATRMTRGLQPCPKLAVVLLLVLPSVNFAACVSGPGNRPAALAGSVATQSTRESQLAEANTLRKRIRDLAVEGKYPEAIPLATKELALRRKLRSSDSPDLAASLSDMGALLAYDVNRWGEAESFLRQALAIYDRALTPDDKQPLSTVSAMCGLKGLEGEYSNSLPYCKRARELAFGSLDDAASAFANYADALRRTGDYASARSVAVHGLAITRVIAPESSYLAESLNALALAAAYDGDYATAYPLYREALDIYDKLEHKAPNDIENQTKVMNNLATLLREHGELAAARSLFEKALSIRGAAHLPEDQDLADALSNLATLLEELGDLETARKVFTQAVAVGERQQNRFDLAITLGGLARMLYNAHEFAEADANFRRAFAVERDTPNSDVRQWAALTNNYAAMLLDQGRADDALTLLHDALHQVEDKAAGDSDLLAGLHNTLGMIYSRRGDQVAARSESQLALDIRRRVLPSNHPTLALTLNDLALIEWRAGASQAVPGRFLEASAIMDSHLSHELPALSFAERRLFLETSVPAQISLDLSMAQAFGSLARSYEYALHWKGILLEFLRDQSRSAPHLDREYSQTEESLRQARQSVAALYHRAGDLPISEWEAKNAALTSEVERLERRVAELSGHRASEEAISVAVLRSALGTDEAFVDCYRYTDYRDGFPGGPRYLAVVTNGQSGPVAIDLGGADVIDGAVKAWRLEVLSGADSTPSWSRVVALIWLPIERRLPAGTRKVLVSPDGDLALVPWQTLAMGKRGRPSALVALLSSPRDLLHKSTPEARTEAAARKWLLVGDIDFDARLGKDEEIADRYPELPGTKAELRSLEDLAARGTSAAILELTTVNATKAAVLNQLPQVDYVHLATHGFFQRQPKVFGLLGGGDLPGGVPGKASRRNPLVESGVVLAGGNLRDRVTGENKGLLTAAEMAGLDLSRCRLFVVSACDAGRGEGEVNQGVLGLGSALVAAGAHTVVLSLWRTRDSSSTQILMTEFYRGVLIEGLSPGEALVRAQVKVRDDPSGRFSDPFYWASWIILGEAWTAER